MNIDEKDLNISTFNTSSEYRPNYNGVRIYHFPSGINVECKYSESVFINKRNAVEILRAKLQAKEIADNLNKSIANLKPKPVKIDLGELTDEFKNV